MKAPSGLRRSVILATFTAMALLVILVWVLEDSIVDGEALAGQRAALAQALDAYVEASRAPEGSLEAIAERVGAEHGSRIRELPRQPEARPGEQLRTALGPDGETRIIELSVVIHDAAFESLGLQRGQLLDDVVPREPA